MKVLKTLSVLALLMFIVTSVSEAQIDRLRNRVQDAADKKEKVTNKAEDVTKDQEFIDYIDAKFAFMRNSENSINPFYIKRDGVNTLEHNKNMKAFDYPAVKKAIMERENSGGADVEKVKILLEYEQEYTDVFNSHLKASINRFIEEAYQKRSKNMHEASKSAQAAFELAEAAMLVIPDNSEAESLYNDSKSSYEAIFEEYLSAIATSEFHKENIGKILFSKEPIVIGKEDPKQFVTEFSADDKIYAVAYLNGTIKDLGGWDYSTGSYLVTISGNEKRIRFTHNEEDHTKSAYIIEIIPDANVAVHGIDAPEFAKILAPLSPRTHTMQLQFGSDDVRDMAISKEITLNWSNINPEAIQANAKKASKNAAENYAKNTKLPDYFSSPSNKFDDKAITEAKIKELFKRYDTDCDEVLKIWISDLDRPQEWHTFNHSTGIPDFMRTNRRFAVAFKAKDGNCYFTWDNMTLARSYEGAGKYSDMRVTSVRYNKTKIACENVKQ